MNKILMAGPSITDVEQKTVAKMMRDGWDNYKYVEKYQKFFHKPMGSLNIVATNFSAVFL